MKPFAYSAPDAAADAVLAVATDPSAVFLGGGTNLVDHLKLGVVEPGLVVDVTGLTSDAVEDLGAGALRIGAAVPNSDLAADPRVRERFPVLSQALLAGATGQLRNMATVGGNPLQRTRCVYFQDVTTPCHKRSPGSGCSAIGGATRNHAVLGASDRCIATHPSDMAVALAALDAEVRVLGVDGERTIPFVDLHRLPGGSPERDTVLGHGELITAIDVPGLPIARRSAYRKVRDRASYAFALVSVAAAVEVVDGVVRDARIAFGGVAHKPWRARRAEEALRGATAADDSYRAAADAELADAVAQDGIDGGNGFKIPLLRRTLVATLRDLAREDA
ncbi:xanthine dehydrogenase family protein subunit M [Pseudonocardia sp. KRD-184]|uniref:Xanthine dehydrogenase family protein subunit M n=1 Tax=Pseudonocardia oceani TaxID=2792013 RepID=A0ABS6U4P5_9PSEU|nr:xanthine dehydrogenase family protein subunit M [Pseudonocardia oceani]MBW0090396.1 xanthine dehydrogenase family protein subunit M [Pseudonocardia oceani]MBW0096682.1 xanthine dehydrogenase family protein subunit M [Pseudonocardia oceani]MBW0121072.1 xanthine dehydrogenase family protein subunit M [Pseudonocardia oceani]MBW0126958.1 xanthine dehydrogenase family protein subunit M [Pseudonocardia oceani]